jgi:uncharacterized membrane protein
VRLPRLTPRVLLWLAIAAHGAGFSALSILRHRGFGSGRFDLGNMVQAVWATAHGHPLKVTNLRGEQISRLGAHVDLLLVAFAPLWRVWPSPSLLLTCQAVVLALGALPVFWLARKLLASEVAALGFALAYLLYPPVQWLALDDFHAVALAPTLLLFALWYLFEDRLVLFGVFAFLAMTTREEVGLVVAAFGFCYAVSRKRWLSGAVICAAGALVTVFAVVVVMRHYHPHSGLRFYVRYADVGGSPFGVLKTALTDPGHVLSIAFDRRGIRYLGQLLLPLCGFWLAGPLLLVSALPQLAINLLAAPPTQTSIHYHYTAPLIPGLFAATVIGAGRLERRWPGSARTLALAAVAVALVSNYRLGAIPVWRYVHGGEKLGTRAWEVSHHDRVTAAALERVPPDAVVSASNTVGAHLSARRRILSFPLLSDATWIALDTYNPSYFAEANAPKEFRRALRRIRRNPRWHVVLERSGVLLLRRAPPR